MDVLAVASESAQAALFQVLSAYPLAIATQTIVVILAAVFFVSGADAGAIVLGSFSSSGTEEPKTFMVIGWGLLVGLVAMTLLIVGGLDALQWGAMVVAAPFVLVLIAMCLALMKNLFADEQTGAHYSGAVAASSPIPRKRPPLAPANRLEFPVAHTVCSHRRRPGKSAPSTGEVACPDPGMSWGPCRGCTRFQAV